ncbi:hypothetical protein FACS1894103_6730 [Campylobacterota bacterium]|nr:hypothetical protein FACS1894103_6730 [Campylobacterota bacterium]
MRIFNRAAVGTLLCAAFAVPSFADFASAQKAYDSGNYKQAENEFRTLFAAQPNDLNINLYLGLCAHQNKNYDLAVSSFDRVLVLEPNNIRAQLELGKTYYDMNLRMQAKLTFDKILTYPIPNNVRENVQRYLADINEKEKKHSFNGNVVLGYLHDSNVNNGSDYEMNLFGENTNVSESKSSNAFNLSGTLNYIYSAADNMSLQTSLHALTQHYSSVKNSDLALYSLTLTPIFKDGANRYSFPIGIEEFQYDGKNYLLTPSVGFKFDTVWGAKTMLNAELLYAKKSNQISANENRDSNYYTASIGGLFIPEAKTMVTAAFGVNLNRKTQGDRADVDYDALFLRSSLFYNFSDRFSTNLNAQYRLVDYKDKPYNVEKGENSERKDNVLSAGAGLNFRIVSSIYLQGTVNYTKQNSNDKYYEYDKTVVGANLLASF